MNMHALLREGSPYIVSGLLMLSGIVFAFVRDVPRRIGSAFARRFIASVTISNGNSIYYWARIWLDRHPYSRRAKNFTAKTVSSSDDSDHGKGGFILTPAFGEHLMRHRGRFVWFERWQENAVDPDRGRRLERMTFRMLGGSRADIERLLEDMAEAARALEKRRTRIFINGARGWSEVATRDPRPLESMVLVEGILENALTDIRSFRDSRAWYRDMGIPHRRGVLLHGPPGTGKSSLVGALAGAFEAPVYLLSLTGPKLGDADLIELFHEVENDAFVLLEDLDAAFDGRKREESSGVTLSGLLNAIDGAASKDGTILFVSTNHPERLDPALTRPGRLDLHIELTYADASQRRRLFERFFPGSAYAESFSEATASVPLTVAQLQEFLLSRRRSDEHAIAEVHDWCRSLPPKIIDTHDGPPPKEAARSFTRHRTPRLRRTRRRPSVASIVYDWRYHDVRGIHANTQRSKSATQSRFDSSRALGSVSRCAMCPGVHRRVRDRCRERR